MKYSVVLGSQNPVKVSAVREILLDFPELEFEFEALEAESGVNDQPQTFEETLQGAKNRAETSYSDSVDISIGLEDGLFLVPDTNKTYMNICVCAIYDGTTFHYGTSSAFEYPEEITDLVKGRGLNISEALGVAGYTSNPAIGSSEGAIGILSEGRMIRKDYTKQSLAAALIHIKKLVSIK